MRATVDALIGLGPGAEDDVAALTIAGVQAGSDGHLIDEAEPRNVADSIRDGGAAAMASIEHVGASPLRDAITRAGGVPVSDGWIRPHDLVEIDLGGSIDG